MRINAQRIPETPQEINEGLKTGPLGGPTAGGPNDGDHGGAGMVGGGTPAHPSLHCGG